ncbi:hypothetical protein AOLI_G00004170, partial [Acnodon oligacanthus]
CKYFVDPYFSLDSNCVQETDVSIVSTLKRPLLQVQSETYQSSVSGEKSSQNAARQTKTFVRACGGVLEVCIIKGFCMYLDEDPEDLVQEYMDVTKAKTPKCHRENDGGGSMLPETPSSKSSDVGVILEVLLHDLENVALAAALLFGLFITS